MMGGALRTENRRRGLIYGLIAVALFVIALSLRSHLAGSGEVTPPQERRPMPSLQFDLLEGGSWRLEDHRGQILVMNYWASWCAPCWEETPRLSRIDQEFASQGVIILGVAMDEHSSKQIPQAVRSFVETQHVPYKVALSPAMSQMAYGMDGLPTTLLIDRQGRVAKIYVGAVQERALRRDLNTLLHES
jgi:peroxiredoxin